MLTLRTDSRPFQFYVMGPTLENTEVKLKWSVEGVALISLDGRSGVVDNPFDPARGQRSLISGLVRAGAVGTTEIEARLVDWNTDPDTTLATTSDTVTVVEPGEGVAEWAGSFFGSSLALTLSAPPSRSRQRS